MLTSITTGARAYLSQMSSVQRGLALSSCVIWDSWILNWRLLCPLQCACCWAACNLRCRHQCYTNSSTQSPVWNYSTLPVYQISTNCWRLGLQQSCKVSKQLLHNLHLSLGLLSISMGVSALQAILESHSKRALLTLLVKVQVIIQGDLSCSY